MSVNGLGRTGGVGGYEPPTDHGIGSAAATTAAPVALGARGPDVTSIQQKLLAAGFDVGSADGIFGRGTERAISDLQRRSGLPTTGQVDAATRAALDSRAGPRIFAAVGAHGRNDPVDVRAVQRKLGDLGFYRGAVDGAYGPQLAKAIQLFDGAVLGKDGLDRSGAAASAAKTIEPGEDAERWLRAGNAPRWEKMPRSGTGFRNADTEGHDWGTSWLSDAVRGAGAEYQRDYRNSHPRATTINTNDASWRRGGDTHDHETHETGMDLDLRLGNGHITFRNASYDREATWAQIKAFLNQPNVDQVRFNDPQVVARANADPRYAGRVVNDPAGVHMHDNHVHVDLRPPAIVE